MEWQKAAAGHADGKMGNGKQERRIKESARRYCPTLLPSMAAGARRKPPGG